MDPILQLITKAWPNLDDSAKLKILRICIEGLQASTLTKFIKSELDPTPEAS